MNIDATKLALIEMLLNTQSETVLIKVRAILENEEECFAEKNYQIVDSRRESYLKGECKSYTRKEPRAKIENN